MNKNFRLLAASFFVGLSILTNAAFAISLDQAKAQGIVGERLDGYLGAVQQTPEATQLVEEINAKRHASYEEIAKKNGAAIQAVELLAAQKAVAKTPSGQFVQLPGGAWSRK